MLNFNLKNLKASHEGPWLIIDFAMLGLLIINLLLIIFDSLFRTEFFRAGLDWLSPAIAEAYLPVHNNFTLVDLGFVAVFLTEFCVRWVVAVARKEYLRWYFYPFAHWYDLIGCIPLSGARIFRFLRVFSILYRLHKYRIIDIRQTALMRFVLFYYNVLIEELSDRIVARVLTDVQNELRGGSPVFDEIVAKVLVARGETVNRWLAVLIQHAGNQLEDQEVGAVLRQHVQHSVSKAVRENRQVGTLSLVPVLGSGIEKMLEAAVADIVIQSMIHLLKDMQPDTIDHFIHHGIQTAPLEEHALNQEVLHIIDECLELIKGHVSHKSWKDQLGSARGAE